jgi:hypothetical protein
LLNHHRRHPVVLERATNRAARDARSSPSPT